MIRLALAIALVAACSGTSTPSTTPEGSGAPPPAKKLVVAWGLTPHGASTDVFLQTTDETGKQVSYPVGTFNGTCQVVKPAEEMKAVIGVNCTAGDAGVELHVVTTPTEIIVLKLPIALGTAPDPMAREEVTRVKAPGGAAIEAGT